MCARRWSAPLLIALALSVSAPGLAAPAEAVVVPAPGSALEAARFDTDLRAVLGGFFVPVSIHGAIADFGPALDPKEDRALVEALIAAAERPAVVDRLMTALLPVARGVFDASGARDARAFLDSSAGRKFANAMTVALDKRAFGWAKPLETAFDEADTQAFKQYVQSSSGGQWAAMQAATREPAFVKARKDALMDALGFPKDYVQNTLPKVFGVLSNGQAPKLAADDTLSPPVVELFANVHAINTRFYDTHNAANLMTLVGPDALSSREGIQRSRETVRALKQAAIVHQQALPPVLAAFSKTLRARTDAPLAQQLVQHIGRSALARSSTIDLESSDFDVQASAIVFDILDLAEANLGDTRAEEDHLRFGKPAAEERYRALRADLELRTAKRVQHMRARQ